MTLLNESFSIRGSTSKDIKWPQQRDDYPTFFFKNIFFVLWLHACFKSCLHVANYKKKRFLNFHGKRIITFRTFCKVWDYISILYDCRPLLRSHYLNLVIIFFCYTYFVTILESYVSRPELYFSTGLSKHEKLFKVKIRNKLRKFSKSFFRMLSSWWQKLQAA